MCTIAELAELVTVQQEAPLPPRELLSLFESGGADAVRARWDERRFQSSLLAEVLEGLAAVAGDPDTGSECAARGVLRMVCARIETRPRLEQVEEGLAFLASPLVGALTVGGSATNRLYALADPAAIVRSLDSLGRAASSAARVS